MLSQKCDLWTARAAHFDIIAVAAPTIRSSSSQAPTLFTQRQQTTAPLRWRASHFPGHRPIISSPSAKEPSQLYHGLHFARARRGFAPSRLVDDGEIAVERRTNDDHSSIA